MNSITKGNQMRILIVKETDLTPSVSTATCSFWHLKGGLLRQAHRAHQVYLVLGDQVRMLKNRFGPLRDCALADLKV